MTEISPITRFRNLIQEVREGENRVLLKESDLGYPHIPTGIPGLDQTIGNACQGLPRGRLVECFCPEGCDGGLWSRIMENILNSGHRVGVVRQVGKPCVLELPEEVGANFTLVETCSLAGTIVGALRIVPECDVVFIDPVVKQDFTAEQEGERKWSDDLTSIMVSQKRNGCAVVGITSDRLDNSWKFYSNLRLSVTKVSGALVDVQFVKNSLGTSQNITLHLNLRDLNDWCRS